MGECGVGATHPWHLSVFTMQQCGTWHSCMLMFVPCMMPAPIMPRTRGPGTYAAAQRRPSSTVLTTRAGQSREILESPMCAAYREPISILMTASMSTEARTSF